MVALSLAEDHSSREPCHAVSFMASHKLKEIFIVKALVTTRRKNNITPHFFSGLQTKAKISPNVNYVNPSAAFYPHLSAETVINCFCFNLINY